MRDIIFTALLIVLLPVTIVGIVAGLIWVGLKLGFNLIDFKLMGYVLDE